MLLLHPPPTLAGREVLVFDGACGLCTWSVRQLTRLGVHATAIPFQRLADADLQTLGLTRDACAERVQFIDAAGTVASGADAVNALLRAHPAFGPVAGVLSRTPVLLELERRAYAWVARHRIAISRLLGTRRYAIVPEDDDDATPHAG